MTATCRLAAIFAANLAGSWRPLGADEKSTFAEVQDDPIEADPQIAGRIVKATGDDPIEQTSESGYWVVQASPASRMIGTRLGQKSQ
jgi:hypothetical protein